MPICANAEERRIRVGVGESVVIFTVRNYTNQEYGKFIGSRFKQKRGGRVTDESYEAKIKFMDLILVGIEAEDENGNPDDVTYRNPENNEINILNSNVPGWTSYVDPSWKLSAASSLEEMNAQIEGDTLKN